MRWEELQWSMGVAYRTSWSPFLTQDPVSPAGSASSYERPIKKERPGTPKAAAPAVSAACLMVDMSVGIRWRVVSMVDNHSLY